MTMAKPADNFMSKGWQKNTTQENVLTATQKPEGSNPGIFRDIN